MFSSRKKKQNEVGKAIQSSRMQNKNIKLCDIIHHQSFITRSTSLGVAKEINLELDFMANSLFWVWKHF